MNLRPWDFPGKSTGVGYHCLRSFIVSGLMFRSLIYFEFIFVYGVRKCSSFILLQVVFFPSLWAFLELSSSSLLTVGKFTDKINIVIFSGSRVFLKSFGTSLRKP